MSTYAVGDLQGCDREFVRLLEKLDFGPQDHLWLVGDLVNRGPASLEVLRRVKAMETQCTVVLGNHDLHFLAMYFGGHRPTRADTLDEVLAAPDVAELAHWLRRQPLLHADESLGYVMVHAGIPHLWDLPKARRLANEVQQVLAGRDDDVGYRDFFTGMYGNEPALWDDALVGMPRYRLITNYLTRMRLVDERGALDFAHKGAVADAPAGWRPWFEKFDKLTNGMKLLFGHWAALDGATYREDVIGLDTGCVWGRDLTALNLHTGEKTVVAAIAD